MWRCSVSSLPARLCNIVATGSLSAGVCYETVAEAVNAYFSAIPVALSVQPAGKIYEVSYIFLAPSWYQQFSVTGSAPVLTLAPVPVFPACMAPSEFFQSGQAFALSLLTIVIVGWAFSAATKALGLGH